jgi:hypothetical protein
VKVRRVTIALVVLLSACSTTTEGVPQGQPHDGTVSAGDGAVIRKPKKAAKLDCAALAPHLADAVHGQATVDVSTSRPDDCHFSAAGGAAEISLITRPQGTKTDDFQGNTAFTSSLHGGDCTVSVVIAKDQWLHAHILTTDSQGDMCAATKAVLKNAFDALPNG